MDRSKDEVWDPEDPPKSFMPREEFENPIENHFNIPNDFKYDMEVDHWSESFFRETSCLDMSDTTYLTPFFDFESLDQESLATGDQSWSFLPEDMLAEQASSSQPRSLLDESKGHAVSDQPNFEDLGLSGGASLVHRVEHVYRKQQTGLPVFADDAGLSFSSSLGGRVCRSGRKFEPPVIHQSTVKTNENDTSRCNQFSTPSARFRPICPDDAGLSGSHNLIRRRQHGLRKQYDLRSKDQGYITPPAAELGTGISYQGNVYLFESRRGSGRTKRRTSSNSNHHLCPHPGCGQSFTYRLDCARHLESAHDVESTTQRSCAPHQGKICPVGSAIVYKPLDYSSGAIRILVLEVGAEDTSIRCRLLHGDLHQDDYETVSYCWGDASNVSSIDIDGSVLEVPSSAVEALRRLRKPNQERRLWIDSVCINQKDDVERSEQVAKMHDIYKRGTCNLIWLGDDDGSVDEAVDIIHSINHEIKQETNNLANYRKTIRTANGELRISESGFSFDFKMDPILKLFARPWFSRMWVIQEQSLSPSNWCHCGRYELPLTDILRVAQWLFHKQSFLPANLVSTASIHDYILHAAILGNFGDPELGWFHKASSSKNPSGILFALLDSLARFETRDPRDRVFGLLGLYQHLSHSNEMPRLIQPSYQKSVTEVFTDATRHSIQEWGRLDVLSWVQHRLDEQPDHMLPSWVPAWHRKWDMSLDARLMGPFFTADAGYVGLQFGTSRPGSINFEGLFVDSRDNCQVETLTGVCHDSHDFPAFLDEAIRLSSDRSASNRAAHQHLEDLAATLLAGRNGDNVKVTDEDLHQFKLFQQYRDQKGTLPPTSRSLDSDSSDPVERGAARFIDAAWNACHRRRFFITRGGYIGLGPQTMQAGDLIVVLYGGKWPFVLRQSREGYGLIGQCYVHGIMFGEAVRQYEASGVKNVVFEIS